MCGICGFIAEPRALSSDAGPSGADASGSCVTPSFAFAHRRLAIIDPDSRSNQPFLDEELGLTVTYNGEIYNYRHLRQELLPRGYRFYTESDTEVLCKAFAHWGIDSVKRLRGMFAFAIYDQKTATGEIGSESSRYTTPKQIMALSSPHSRQPSCSGQGSARR